jgi:hypothetical protein
MRLQRRDLLTCPHEPNCFLRIDEPGPCDGYNDAVEDQQPLGESVRQRVRELLQRWAPQSNPRGRRGH